jgi:hypothetical protein
VLAKLTLLCDGGEEDLEEGGGRLACLQKVDNNYATGISYLHLEKDMWCVEFGRAYIYIQVL